MFFRLWFRSEHTVDDPFVVTTTLQSRYDYTVYILRKDDKALVILKTQPIWRYIGGKSRFKRIASLSTMFEVMFKWILKINILNNGKPLDIL